MKARLVSTIIAFLLATTAFAQYPEAIFTYDSSNMQFSVPIHKGSLAIDVQDSTLYFITEDYISTDKLDDAIAAGHTVKISGAGASFDPSTLEDSLLQHRTDINWLLNNLQADSLYIRYMTEIDTSSGWKRNDTVNIPVPEPGTDYSWNYQQGSYEAEITAGDEVEFVGYDGINLFTRSILAGGVQLGIAAAADNQWFNYAVIHNSGWTYDITPGYHFIQGEYYSIDAAGSVTLDAAHATLDRIDVIAVDTNENFVVLKGTEGANPAKPTVDPLSQLELTFIKVDAAATEPGIDTELVYDENDEWTTESTPVADVTVDFGSTETPKEGDSCIFISHDTGGSIDAANISFTDATTHAISGQNITMYLRSSDEWARRTRLIIFIYNDASIVGAVTLNRMSNMYGFDDTDNDWQRISIPIEDFNPTDIEFDKIYILTKGFVNACDLSFDYIEIQDESGPPGTTDNLLTQNNITRTSYSIPLNNAAYITGAGNYRVGSTTSNVPVGVEGALIAIYNSTAASGMVYMLIDEDSGDVYTSVDKGTTWTEVGGGGGTSYWEKTGNYVYPATIGDSIGIGTETPIHALDVNGNIMIKDKLFFRDSPGQTDYMEYSINGLRLVHNNNQVASPFIIEDLYHGITQLEIPYNAPAILNNGLKVTGGASKTIPKLELFSGTSIDYTFRVFIPLIRGASLVWGKTLGTMDSDGKFTAMPGGWNGVLEFYEDKFYFNVSDEVDVVIISDTETTINNDLVASEPATFEKTLSTGQIYITDNDATPDVSSGNIAIYSGSANSVTLTDLDNPIVNAIYTIVGNSDTYTISINDSGNFDLSGNWTGGDNDVIRILVLADNDYIEISRKDN